MANPKHVLGQVADEFALADLRKKARQICTLIDKMDETFPNGSIKNENRVLAIMAGLTDAYFQGVAEYAKHQPRK